VSSANGNAYVELKDAVQVQFAPPTSSTTDPVQSIFFISSGGGMYNAAFMGTTFVNWAPYYAPYVPNPLPGPGVPPCP
jgi:hypothetical protein